MIAWYVAITQDTIPKSAKSRHRIFCQWNHLLLDRTNHIIAGKKKSTKQPPKAPPIDSAGPALGKKIAKQRGIMFVKNNTSDLFNVGNSP